ncbi:hypothetical protein DS843_23025 [Roseomonas genomospecies 6]|uniref:Uncharacterized protein n=1 Tax=Roseomonas genomospecies 6 TaxID=214106 RepID=A0A9W7KQL6_9PROT|nr:hypothetical protein DS843_23025 [Roseomonas genomospecies 6]
MVRRTGHHTRRTLLSVGESDDMLVASGCHMIVGHDVAALIPDDAGAMGGSSDWSLDRDFNSE